MIVIMIFPASVCQSIYSQQIWDLSFQPSKGSRNLGIFATDGSWD